MIHLSISKQALQPFIHLQQHKNVNQKIISDILFPQPFDSVTELIEKNQSIIPLQFTYGNCKEKVENM